jgi:hypothetical protein
MSPKDQAFGLAVAVYRERGADLVRYLRHRLQNEADARDIAKRHAASEVVLNQVIAMAKHSPSSYEPGRRDV